MPSTHRALSSIPRTDKKGVKKLPKEQRACVLLYRVWPFLQVWAPDGAPDGHISCTGRWLHRERGGGLGSPAHPAASLLQASQNEDPLLGVLSPAAPRQEEPEGPVVLRLPISLLTISSSTRSSSFSTSHPASRRAPVHTHTSHLMPGMASGHLFGHAGMWVASEGSASLFGFCSTRD